jgi:hypothetical protein
MDTQTFLNRLQELYNSNVEISRRKNADYAGSSDPFKNFRACENLGITSAEKGILVRMTDKLQRISNLLETDAQVKDESIIDTLQDLANYSMILAVYIESKKK